MYTIAYHTIPCHAILLYCKWIERKILKVFRLENRSLVVIVVIVFVRKKFSIICFLLLLLLVFCVFISYLFSLLFLLRETKFCYVMLVHADIVCVFRFSFLFESYWIPLFTFLVVDLFVSIWNRLWLLIHKKKKKQKTKPW